MILLENIKQVEDAKKQCDILIIGLQTDPTIDRKEKNMPIQSYKERYTMISSIKYVDKEGYSAVQKGFLEK